MTQRSFKLQILLLSLSFLLQIVSTSQLRSGSDQANIELLSDIINFYSDSKMNSLKIEGDVKTDAMIEFLLSPSGFWQLALRSDNGAFVIRNEQVEIFEASSTQFILRARETEFRNIAFDGYMNIGGVKQWKQVIHETFWDEPVGWSNNQISKCGGIFMLGGYGITASKVLQKTFEFLPIGHSVLRITGSFHFIDSWSGETAYIGLVNLIDESVEYQWTHDYDLAKSKNGINICGSDYPEAHLTTHFDFSVPHTGSTITLAFGATLDEDPYENSYGISNLQIYAL